MPTVRHGKYVMDKDLDFDLQEEKLSDESSLMAYANFEKARRKALEMLNTQLKNKMNMSANAADLFALSDFKPTQFGFDKSTGKKNSACQWEAVKTSGHGNNERKIYAMIDVDDIPPGVAQNGPDRPHVGFSFWVTAVTPTLNVKRANGHVFISHVHVSRNAD